MDKLKKKMVRIGVWAAGLLSLFVLYASGLSYNPPGFYVDESALSYNAYLVSRTAGGEFGSAFPLYFQLYGESFAQYTSPTQIYLLGLYFVFVPPSILAARLFSAFWVFAACMLLGVLARRLSNSRLVGVIVAFTALVTPWFFDIRGLLLESHFIPFAVVIFLLAIQRARIKESWSWLDAGMIAGGLCLITYCYTSGRGLAVILAAGLAIFATKRAHITGVLKTWLLYCVGLLPLVIYSFQNPGVLTRRLYQVSAINPAMPFAEMFSVFTTRYLEDIDLTALLLVGDHHARHHVPGSGGAIFFATFALAVVGFGVLALTRRIDRWWLYGIFGLFASVVPGAVTNEAFHQLRLMAYPVFLLLLTVPALEWLIFRERANGPADPEDMRYKPIDWLAELGLLLRRGAVALFLLATILQAISYMSVFRETGPQRHLDFDAAYKPVYDAAVAQSDRPIYLEDGFWGPAYIHALWYAAVDGLDRSNFVHLAEREVPPDGSLVLSSHNTCSRCEVVMRGGSYLLYKTTGREGMLEPPAQNTNAPPPVAPIEANLLQPKILSPPVSKPHGIAVDATGNIYVTDAGNSRLLKLAPSGDVITAIGQGGDATLAEPTGVAIDAAGDIYVTDGTKKELFRFKADGTFIRKWGPADTGFDELRDVAVGADKQVYVTDRGHAHIVRLDPDSGIKAEWGSSGSDPGQFNSLNGIAIGGENVYVADAQNNRVEVFDLAGNFVRQWPVSQWASYLWHRPDLAVDTKAGLAYVTSGWSHEVLVFDLDGNFVKLIKPDPPASFNNPSSIVLSDTKRGKFLYVLNTASDVVEMGPSSIFVFDLGNGKK